MESLQRHRPEAAQAPGNLRMDSHIYVHVPFCIRKCSYCDFFSVPYSSELANRYLEALETELEQRLPSPAAPHTLYIGGGTPTSLSAEEFEKLFAVLREHVQFASLQEFTVEVNPGTLTEEKIAALKSACVNRVSLGVQSLDGRKLKLLGRIHSGREAREAFGSLSKAGFDNIGIDLIYGVPGDTESLWLEDLRTAAELGPKHVSTYCLSLEPGTPLAHQVQRGEVSQLAEELQKALYYRALAFLTAQGFEHYEISNFALPGRGSRHNMATWRYEPFLGFGPAAVSFDRTTRRKNPSDLAAYCEASAEPAEIETLEQAQKAREVVMLSLRTREGITAEEFHSRCGLDLKKTFGRRIAELESTGMLEYVQRDGKTALRIRQEKLFVSDEVLVGFF